MTDQPLTEQEVRLFVEILKADEHPVTPAGWVQELAEDWLRLQQRLAEAMASRERWTRRTMQRSAQLAEAKAALEDLAAWAEETTTGFVSATAVRECADDALAAMGKPDA